MYDINRIIWNNDLLKVTYVGVKEHGNFWGVRMLVENKSDEKLTLFAHDIRLNNHYIGSSEVVIGDLLPHKIMFGYATIMFYAAEEIGVNSVDKMTDLELKLECWINDKPVCETKRKPLVPRKYNEPTSSVRLLCGKKQKSLHVISKKKKLELAQLTGKICAFERDQIIIDDDLLQVTYLGFFKYESRWSEGKWSIEFKFTSKVDCQLYLSLADAEIDNYLLGSSGVGGSVFLKPKTDSRGQLSISFNAASAIGITSIDEFNAVHFCIEPYIGDKPTGKIYNIVAYPVDYVKELLSAVSELNEEIHAGKVWKDNINERQKIKFLFKYPNGKNGHVDYFLISEFGKKKQLAALLYEATITAADLHQLELMVLYYQLWGSNTYELTEENSNALSFLQKNNNIMKLSTLCEILSHEMSYEDRNSNVICKAAKSIIKEKCNSLKAMRDEIYGDLIANKKVTSKWKSEQQLFAIAKSEYGDAMYQYKAQWLGAQSLDIFIPSIKVGIEYQGTQHYKPVEIFGGEEHFKMQQKLDAKKRELCKQHGIRLIEWKYDVPISVENFKLLGLENL